MGALRATLIWAALLAALVIPIGVAATSPLLAWRQPVYIAAGLAGAAAMSLLLLQPLLADGRLPGLRARRGRTAHGWVGVALVLAIVVHVGGLWATSPPDVVDALLFRSPTPFSDWGVIAMWAALAAAVLAAARRRLRPAIWRLAHTALALTTVFGGVAHALLIEGTMGSWSKAAICGLVLAATLAVAVRLRSWAVVSDAARGRRRRARLRTDSV
jgi:predicted ferric reductase